MEDSSGHKHDDDGKFSATSGSKKAAHDKRKADRNTAIQSKKAAEAASERTEELAYRLPELHEDALEPIRNAALDAKFAYHFDKDNHATRAKTAAERASEMGKLRRSASELAGKLSLEELPPDWHPDDHADHRKTVTGLRKVAAEALRAEKGFRAAGAYLAARRAERKAGKVTESLAVPVVLQGTDWSCGSAALQAVLDFHGVRVDNAQLRQALGTDPDDGTQPEALVALVESLGLSHEVRTPATLEDLAHAIAHGAPCLCCIQADGGGHWVTVTAVEDGAVRIVDPVRGVQTIPADVWLAGWYDEAHGKRYERWALAVGPPPLVREGLEGSALTYPVWRYVAVVDAASRPWHASRNGNYYPAAVTFEQVRGTEAADTEHCRCRAVRVSHRTWLELQSQGARLTAG